MNNALSHSYQNPIGTLEQKANDIYNIEIRRSVNIPREQRWLLLML
jgi:hypothetical protein